MSREHFSAIRCLIENRTGLAMGEEMQRRMANILPGRLARGDYRRCSEYYHFLRDDPASGQEIARLVALLTARKPRLMHPDLAEHVLRFARSRMCSRQKLAVLAIGPCASDDVYSAAIALAQEDLDPASPSFTFAGADVDLNRLLRAADGFYSSRAVAGVAPPVLERLFDRVSMQRYRIRESLRERVQWLHVGIREGPGHSLRSRRWDLILCRELLMCLTEQARPAWARIGEMLSPCGVLIADCRAEAMGDLECSRCGKLCIHVRHEGWREDEHEGAEILDSRRSAALGTVLGMLKQTDCDAAIRQAEAIACEDPANAACRAAIAVLLLRKKAFAEAQAHALAALAIDPHSPEALMACAMAYERQDRLKTAELFYRKALLVRPTMASAHLQLADVLRKLDREPEARKIYARLQEMLGVGPDRRIGVSSASSKVFRVDVNSTGIPDL